MPPKGSGRQLYRVRSIRLSADEDAAIARAATAAGQSWSDYVRLVVGGWLVLHPPPASKARRRRQKNDDRSRTLTPGDDLP